MVVISLSRIQRASTGSRLGVSIILAVIALAGGFAYYQFVFLPTQGEGDGEGNTVTIDVLAKQWTFVGPDGTSNITVPKGKWVVLRVNSTMEENPDPSFTGHGLLLAAFDVNEFLPVGEVTTVKFFADEAGVYPFQCTVYCGLGHVEMNGFLIITEG
ncbi:MAG: hypothetical protein ACE5IB_06445 [Candidatus Geothermarchaeales archaeon]